MAVSYKTLGLVNSKAIFEKAITGGYAIPGYNFSQMEQLQAVVTACVETESPVILQISSGARKYANSTILRHLAHGATEFAREIHPQKKLIPIVLHLDHGDSFELCKGCIESGFSSVMIDGSHLPYDENVALTKRVVDFAHSQPDYVTVEGELGILAGVEDDVKAEKHTYTQPEEVQDFVSKTGVDSLAIAIGTSHGAYKFPPGTKAEIRLDILHEIEARLPGFPIVLHGSSSIPKEYVDIVNTYGGKMPDAVGIPETQLREASRSAVCKINIDSDGRIVMTGSIRKYLAEHPDHFDPRQYIGAARTNLTAMYKRKNIEVLGSAGHAFD
jgi:fructose-bisphosphate aldolase class II